MKKQLTEINEITESYNNMVDDRVIDESKIKYQGHLYAKPKSSQTDPWSARDYANAQLNFVADQIHNMYFSEGHPVEGRGEILDDILDYTDTLEKLVNKLIGKFNNLRK